MSLQSVGSRLPWVVDSWSGRGARRRKEVPLSTVPRALAGLGVPSPPVSPPSITPVPPLQACLYFPLPPPQTAVRFPEKFYPLRDISPRLLVVRRSRRLPTSTVLLRDPESSSFPPNETNRPNFVSRETKGQFSLPLPRVASVFPFHRPGLPLPVLAARIASHCTGHPPPHLAPTIETSRRIIYD
jgi:hypothetical protein